MSDQQNRTAFPWVPATRWQQEKLPNSPAIIWHVEIVNPEPHPQYIKSMTARGPNPRDAINTLRDHVSWWLDWDGRRKGTVREVYIERPK